MKIKNNLRLALISFLALTMLSACDGTAGLAVSDDGLQKNIVGTSEQTQEITEAFTESITDTALLETPLDEKDTNAAESSPYFHYHVDPGYEAVRDYKQRVHEPLSHEPEEHITLFETQLKANGKTYDCDVYIYWLYEETKEVYRGLLAMDLYYGGELLDTSAITCLVGNLGPEFDKGDMEKYFDVIEGENDVFAYSNLIPLSRLYSSFTEAQREMLHLTSFYTVSAEEKIIRVQRYIEEGELLYKYDTAALWLFRITDSYERDGDKILYHFIDEKGEDVNLTISFEFENYELRCCDEYSRSVVYCGI